MLYYDVDFHELSRHQKLAFLESCREVYRPKGDDIVTPYFCCLVRGEGGILNYYSKFLEYMDHVEKAPEIAPYELPSYPRNERTEKEKFEYSHYAKFLKPLLRRAIDCVSINNAKNLQEETFR